MKKFPRSCRMLAGMTAGLLFTMAPQLAGAQDARAILPLSPESGSVQIAKGLRNGTVQLPSSFKASGVQEI